MDLLSFMSSFKCCKNFPLKIIFSKSNYFEVYAIVHYKTSNVGVIIECYQGDYSSWDNVELWMLM